MTRRSGQHAERSRSRVVVLALTLFSLTASLRASDMIYTNWPPEPEWVALTNHIHWCYEQLRTRCEILGINPDLQLAEPTYVYPAEDYRAFASEINELAHNFLNFTCATNGTFASWFSHPIITNGIGEASDYHQTLPFLDEASLRVAAGFTNWADTAVFSSWCTWTNRSIMRQVEHALAAMKWTTNGGWQGGGAREGVSGTGCGPNWWEAITNAMVDFDSSAGELGYPCASSSRNWDWIGTGESNGEWEVCASMQRRWAAVIATRPTNCAAAVEVYFRVEGGLWTSFTNNGDQGLSASEWPALQWQANLNGTSLSVTSTYGNTNLPFPAWVDEPEEVPDGPFSKGYSCGPALTVMKWDVDGGLSNNAPDDPYADLGFPVHDDFNRDSDRDDIVDIGVEVASFGPDSGTLQWIPAQDSPYAVIPLAVPPAWYAGIPVVRYFTGSPSLPYQTHFSTCADTDGVCSAFSFNTCVMESVILSNDNDWVAHGFDSPVKRATVLRPRGQLVVFDFPWDAGQSQFSAIGYPIGVNSNRTYALRDLNAASNDVPHYELQFASGVRHRFAPESWLSSVCPLATIWDRDGRQSPPWTTLWCDSYFESPPGESGALSLRYDAGVYWTNDRPCAVAYVSLYDTGAVLRTLVSWDPSSNRVLGIAKSGLSGIEAMNASVDGNAIEYGNGARTIRTSDGSAGSARSVTLRTELPGTLGSLTNITSFDARDYVVESAVGGAGATSATHFTYQAAAGRYANGLLKGGQVAAVQGPDGRTTSFSYDASTGWLESMTEPSAWGDVQTVFSYTSHDANLDPGPSSENWAERPRTAVSSIGGTVVRRTLYAYQGPYRKEVQQCLASAAAWGAAGNLSAGATYVTNGDANGHAQLAWTPTATTSNVFWIGDQVLDIAATSSTKSVDVTLNAFGFTDYEVVRRDGAAVSSRLAMTNAPFGLPLAIENLDGSTQATLEWDFRGPLRSAEVDGSQSTRGYDALGRPASFSYLGQSNSVSYDALGRISRQFARAGDGSTNGQESAWDGLGRPTMQADHLGVATFTHQFSPQDMVVTSTESRPDGSAVVTKRHADGTLLEVSGNGAAERIVRVPSIVGGQRCVTEYVGDANSQRWVRYAYDLAGRLASIQRSAATGATVISYDSSGRPYKATDENGVTRLLEYDEADEIAKQGLNLGGSADTLEETGLDRFAKTTRQGRSETVEVFPTKNSGQASSIFSAATSADAKGVTGTVADRPFAGRRSEFGAGGAWSLALTNTDGSVWTCRYEDWQLHEVERARGGHSAKITYERDGLGRVSAVVQTRGGVERRTDLTRDGAGRITGISPPGISGTVHLGYKAHTDLVDSLSDTDGSTLSLTYADNGMPTSRSGAGEIVEWEYTDAAELAEQRTFPSQGQGVETEWVRDEHTGFVEQKKINGDAVELYSRQENGEVASVTTAGGQATIQRSQAGEVQGAQFNDGKTPSRGVEFDRAGRLIGDGLAGGVSNSYTLAADGRVTTNTVFGAGAVADHQWVFTYDAESEALTAATLVRSGSTRTIAWGHDTEPKVTSVSDAGTVGAAYGWIEAVPGVGLSAVVVNGVTNPVVLTREWNVQRGAVTGVSYQAGASVLASFRYSHPTNGTRASRLTLGDGSYWEYGYDAAGRLTNAVRKTAAGAAIPGFSFRYAFDGAGNSVAAGPATPTGALWTFEAAPSQFHVRRIWSNLVEIVGQAASDAVVSVRTEAGIVRAERSGLWFAARVPVSNQSAAVCTAITVAAVRNDGTNDLVQETRGRLFVPKQDEAVTNSAAGAILNDSRWTFTWDWYRRLIAAESSGRTPEIKLDFTYDPEGRRVRKQVSEKSGGNWELVRTHRFTNLGWRPVEEEIVTTSNAVVREYVWGLDLSGTPEGAGGIGGLVAIRQGETVLLPLCDAMGNVRHLVDSQGAIVASYDYDPFGRLIARSGVSADACPFLYSTKYLDEETGFYYFGYRYYDPASLKWLCRDPLGESAGPNLTAFCRNDPVNNFDPLGLDLITLPYAENRGGLAASPGSSTGVIAPGLSLTDTPADLPSSLRQLLVSLLFDVFLDQEMGYRSIDLDDAASDMLDVSSLENYEACAAQQAADLIGYTIGLGFLDDLMGVPRAADAFLFLPIRSASRSVSTPLANMIRQGGMASGLSRTSISIESRAARMAYLRAFRARPFQLAARSAGYSAEEISVLRSQLRQWSRTGRLRVELNLALGGFATSQRATVGVLRLATGGRALNLATSHELTHLLQEVRYGALTMEELGGLTRTQVQFLELQAYNVGTSSIGGVPGLNERFMAWLTALLH